MSVQSWTFDAPTGVYKNHAMSQKLRAAAIAQTLFTQFVQPEPGYGRKKGESITITRVSNINANVNGRLDELKEIPEDELTLSTIAITVSEWGRSIPVTSLADDLSEFDVENVIQRKLRDQMSLILDKAAASAFKTAQVRAAATGTSSLNISTNGTFGATASANLDAYHVERIRDYMFNDLTIPFYEDGTYICLCSTKAKRGLMNDPKWEEFHKYGNAEMKFRGEVGKMEGIRFIEVNNSLSLSSSVGSGGVAGEAIFFGEDAVAMAVAMDPELRVKIPTDYGRSRGVAWYGILEFGIIWDTANAGEARIVYFGSA